MSKKHLCSIHLHFNTRSSIHFLCCSQSDSTLPYRSWGKFLTKSRINYNLESTVILYLPGLKDERFFIVRQVTGQRARCVAASCKVQTATNRESIISLSETIVCRKTKKIYMVCTQKLSTRVRFLYASTLASWYIYGTPHCNISPKSIL